ncbi:ABC transporter ATP-binding protein [Pseudarthrobacter sp. NPDC092439]|uniref:ABC transporter ATP-binding protein n=1 Tax=unclassified Pseudarthrobacter TaxID=2647000 RepID=UPI003804C2B9
MHATPVPALAAGIRSFAFHGEGTPALNGVDVSFAPGSCTAIIGASGSGKSTLGRLLAGWLSPGSHGTLHGHLAAAGTVLEFDGGPEDPRIDPAAWGRLVGFVPQDAAAAVSTVRATVAEELAFGLENAGVERAAMAAAVDRTAALVGLDALLEQDPATLSGGQLRRLAIGCAVISGPPVLVLDEPAASLDSEGLAELVRLVGDLSAAGTAVVILSQAVDELVLAAPDWVVLSAGTAAARGHRDEFLQGEALLPAAVRRPLFGRPGSAPRAVPAAHHAESGKPSAAALEFRAVAFSYPGARTKSPARPVLDGVDLTVRPGEIVAVTGANGAGKSTLLRHANGLLQPDRGTVLVQGRGITGKPVGEVAASVGFLFQHPRHQLFERSALREVRFGLERLFPAAEADRRARAALEAVGLLAAAHLHPAELPGSRQRLLALATVLARRPAVLALDEPTVALDADGLAVLDAAVRSAAAEGAAVVLVTHDLDYARTAAHRVVALEDGRLAGS